jgi:hypothetical protein
MSKRMVVVGGDPELMRENDAAWARGTSEFPCQQCGRSVLLTEESQRLALGDAVGVVPFKLLKDGGVEVIGPPETNESAAMVLCLWCAFADKPEILAALGVSK